MRLSETTKYLSNYLTFGRILSRLNNSRWDRYLGMTAAMTQLPVPTATGQYIHRADHLLYPYVQILHM
jgi:hypothetical protein